MTAGQVPAFAAWSVWAAVTVAFAGHVARDWRANRTDPAQRPVIITVAALIALVLVIAALLIAWLVPA